jgi:hypothetical protein
MRIRIQHFRLNTDPDPGVLMTKKIVIFGSETTIYLSLGLNKGRSRYKKSLQLSNENIQHFKT